MVIHNTILDVVFLLEDMVDTVVVHISFLGMFLMFSVILLVDLRHTKLSSTCVLYSNVIIYLACMNYISYSWVAVLIVGVVAADFQNSRCPTQPVLFYWPFSTKSGFKPRHPHYYLLRHRPPEGHRREGVALEARGQSEPWPGLHHSHHHIDPQRDTVGCL